MILELAIVLLTFWTGNNVLAEQGEGWYIYHSKELAELSSLDPPREGLFFTLNGTAYLPGDTINNKYH